jgi:hypothetical protein
MPTKFKASKPTAEADRKRLCAHPLVVDRSDAAVDLYIEDKVRTPAEMQAHLKFLTKLVLQLTAP